VSRRPIQEPTQTKRSDPLGGTEFTHPAYAQIGASRVTGAAVLYGSDFVHHQYICVRIAKSTLTRSLSNDWLFADSLPYIEVDLSEAQWASFVSSMNVGSGVSCTLRFRDKQEIPGLPDPVQRTETFAAEAKQMMGRALTELKSLEEAIHGSGLSGKKVEALSRQVQSARSAISGNLGFVADQFGEHMEKVTESAKVEVNAYAINTLMRAGLQALSNGKPVIELLTDASSTAAGAQKQDEKNSDVGSSS
jgi:hypothetical protein